MPKQNQHIKTSATGARQLPRKTDSYHAVSKTHLGLFHQSGIFLKFPAQRKFFPAQRLVISYAGNYKLLRRKFRLSAQKKSSEAKLPRYAGFAIEPKLSIPDYYIPKELSLKSEAFTVNKYLFQGLKAVSKFSLYQGATSNCVNWSSLGLWLNGIPNIGIHPFLLHGSMAIYNTGVFNVLAGQLTSYPHY